MPSKKHTDDFHTSQDVIKFAQLLRDKKDDKVLKVDELGQLLEIIIKAEMAEGEAQIALETIKKDFDFNGAAKEWLEQVKLD